MPLATFPNIDYSFWLKNYSWENFSSMNGMITTMKNKKYINNNITPENITSNIQLKIESYIKKNDDEVLFEIFKLIQTWGGKSTGSNTLKICEEWENVIENDVYKTYKEKYREFVKLMIDGKSIDSFYKMTNKKKIIDKIQNKNTGLNIKGLSFSFVPKHICFWSGLGDRTKGLPILDDVIAKIVYKVNKAENVDYKTFIEDINIHITSLNVNLAEENKFIPSHIEMALFAFSGNYWDTQKTATNEIRKEPKIKSNDISEAIKIGEIFKNNNGSKLNNENKPKEFKNKTNRKKISKTYDLYKNELHIASDGTLFIKIIAIERCKISLTLIDKTKYIKSIKGDIYYKFSANHNLINIIK